MSQELDGGTLTLLLILIGYWYWSLSRSTGNPPPSGVRAKRPERRGSALALPQGLADPPPRGEERAWGQPVDSAAAEVSAVLQAADTTFDAAVFARGAVAAYQAVLTAFAKGDASVLADLASADVHAAFMAALATREEGGEHVEWMLLNVEAVELVHATVAESVASITVRFSSRFLTHKGCAGNNGAGPCDEVIVDTKDEWTFAREFSSTDPNWTLVATRSV